jgi:hypothetical protein
MTEQMPLFPATVGRLTLQAWRARLEAEASPPCCCEDADHCKHCRCEDCAAWERAWLAALTGKHADCLPVPPGAVENPQARDEVAMLEAMLRE